LRPGSPTKKGGTLIEQQYPPEQPAPNQPPPPSGKTSGWVIAGITIPTVIMIIIALPLLCILVAICVIVILALLGPAIGNVFSNIVLNV